MPFIDPDYLKANRYDYSISILQRELDILTKEYVRVNYIWGRTDNNQENKGIYNMKKKSPDLLQALANLKARISAIEDSIELLQGFNLKEINS